MYNRIYETFKHLAEFVQSDVVWDEWKGHIKYLGADSGVLKFQVDDGQLIIDFLEELGPYSYDSKGVRHYEDSTLCTWVESRSCWKFQQFRQILCEVYLM